MNLRKAWLIAIALPKQKNLHSVISRSKTTTLSRADLQARFQSPNGVKRRGAQESRRREQQNKMKHFRFGYNTSIKSHPTTEILIQRIGRPSINCAPLPQMLLMMEVLLVHHHFLMRQVCDVLQYLFLLNYINVVTEA